MYSLMHLIGWRIGLRDVHTWTRPEEIACLARHAAGRTRLAEIGVWQGATTRRLRRAMAPGATLFAIDPYPTGRLGVSYQKIMAHGEVGRVSNGTVIWIEQKGVDAAGDPSVTAAAPFDFVFVDGDHTYEALHGDWTRWSPLIAPGGIIALHDSVLPPDGGAGAGSMRYFAEVIACDDRFDTIDTVYSLSVLRRRQRELR
jgi:predicted O-methyltransferase YrrM